MVPDVTGWQSQRCGHAALTAPLRDMTNVNNEMSQRCPHDARRTLSVAMAAADGAGRFVCCHFESCESSEAAVSDPHSATTLERDMKRARK